MLGRMKILSTVANVLPTESIRTNEVQIDLPLAPSDLILVRVKLSVFSSIDNEVVVRTRNSALEEDMFSGTFPHGKVFVPANTLVEREFNMPVFPSGGYRNGGGNPDPLTKLRAVFSSGDQGDAVEVRMSVTLPD